ncbi:MAG: TraM recognition domain-containing protein [Patescibacteria group bacterium]|nr:TraM recognition domain-containing protein [Patescibacteria group bacterium]MDD5172680.1 TraM recognition domain-containing protein [Patescibacteria group bacterium]
MGLDIYSNILYWRERGFFNLKFWLPFFVLILFLILFFFLKKYLRRSAQYKFSFQRAILLVTVPKIKMDKEEKEKTPKEMLQPIENFFDNIGGLKAQKGFKTWFLGRSDHFSFEILSDKQGIISFYVVVPRNLQTFFEQQVHAQYPAAQIEEVDDYNVFLPHGEVVCASLTLRTYSMFPIKTYNKTETDPLNAITNSLSRIAEEDSAAIQIMVRSAQSGWRQPGIKVALEMQQGKKLSEALKNMSGGLSKFFSFLTDFIFPKSQKKQDKELDKPHQLSPMEQEVVKTIEEKASKAGMDVNIRIVVSARDKGLAESYLDNIVNAFAQYTGYEYGNGFKKAKMNKNEIIRNFIYRNFNENISFVLNTEEMASIYHFPLPTTETPNIRWLMAKKAPAPINIPHEGLFLGYNIYRGQKTAIKIKREDRRRHMYVIGMTGTGKSWFAEGLAMQDIANGEGICFIDPHGDAIGHILERIPKNRAEDVILFDPGDLTRPLGLNMLEYDFSEQKTFVINEIMNIFDKLYDLRATGGPIFEQYFKNACHLVMDDIASGSTLLEIPKVLADDEFRRYKLSKCKTLMVKEFWEKQALKAGGEASLQNMVPYITSKLTPFLTNEFMQPIISQQKSSLNFREAMDNKKIILAKLSKGKIGDTNAYLLGMIIVGKILMSALSRGDMPEEKRNDFYLYIDEFQNFLTESMQVILSEARKYRLCLNIIHQYIGQLVKNSDTKFKDSIFGNVGTKIAFRIGVDDAEDLTKEFAPVFNEYDFLNMPQYSAFVKLLIDNANPPGFNISTVPFDQIPGVPPANPEIAKIIKELSQLKYGKTLPMIEREISQRSQIINQLKQTTDGNLSQI